MSEKLTINRVRVCELINQGLNDTEIVLELARPADRSPASRYMPIPVGNYEAAAEGLVSSLRDLLTNGIFPLSADHKLNLSEIPVLPIPEPAVLNEPLDFEGLRTAMDDDGFVTARVYVDLDRAVESHDHDEWMDHLSRLVTGCDSMVEIEYKVVQLIPDGSLVLEVTGSVLHFVNAKDRCSD